MILLDTSVLSVAFRRRRPSGADGQTAMALRRLVTADAPLAVPGIVLQELLGGVRDERQFARLEGLIEGFEVVLAERRDHLAAARIANACRRAGIATSTIDCLIAALAIERSGTLFTLDSDFTRMAPHCGLRLWRPERGGA